MVVSETNPVPVTVAGLPQLADEIGRQVGAHIVRPPDVNVEPASVTIEPAQVNVQPPVVNVDIDLGVLERYARLGLYGLVSIGLLQVTLIITLIFVR
jgi:hypothetical protein